MKYTVTCTAEACYLRPGAPFVELVAAETVAFAHEQRMADRPDSHVCTVHPITASKKAGGNSGPERRPL